jgi:hypothetical protein
MTTILAPETADESLPVAHLLRSRHEHYSLTRGIAQIVPATAMSHHLLARTDLARHVCDHRYYALVHRTLGHDFPISYFVLYDKSGIFRGAQPFFIVDQNILAGVQGKVADLASRIRMRYPSFLTLKTLMLGNPAGPGVLGVRSHSTSDEQAAFVAELSEALAAYAARHRVRIVVFKDFPAMNRAPMARLTEAGGGHAANAAADFVRLPSMPMTSLSLTAYESFDDYMSKSLSKVTRKGLRRKFKLTSDEKIEFSVTSDISESADEIYRLYLQVYERATLKFEKITAQYLRELCREMPERARFFLWRKRGQLVAASVTLVQLPGEGVEESDSALYDLYLGMEYPLALDLSLYFMTMRDVIQWSIDNRIATYYSTPLNYDAKLHFRHRLVPLDLYVRHTSPVLNPAFQFAMRFAEPTRHDRVLPLFPNAHELK